MAKSARLQRRESAIFKLGEFVASVQGTELGRLQLREYDKESCAGWIVPSAAGELAVLVDDGFPFSPPSVFLHRNHPKRRGAHVEASGRLCLAPTNATYSQDDPIVLFKALLDDAVSLLNREDFPRSEFLDEFDSYWVRDTNPSRTDLLLCAPNGPTRSVFAWHGLKVSVFADSHDEVESWVRKRHQTNNRVEVVEEIFIWLSDGVIPVEFPRTGREVLGWVSKQSPESLPYLLKRGKAPPVRIIFGFNTGNGPAFGGITLRAPKDFENGFRRGMLSDEAVTVRLFGQQRITSSHTQRIDHAWLHARGGEAQFERLLQKRVALVGCGSLGGGVAMLLAKIGVGHLTLIDPDIMGWDNVSRHVLGGKSTGSSKASALAKEIEGQLLGGSAQAIEAKWQVAVDSGRLIPEEYDLIISTTGDWISDSMLNFEGRSSLSFPPVIFGWLEQHALAGNALLVGDLGGCLACGMDEFGNFQRRLTAWPSGDKSVRLTACGGSFQPYGAGYLCHTQALISNMAADYLLGNIKKSEYRSWAAPVETIALMGGARTSMSLEFLPEGGGFHISSWSRHQTCPLC